MATGPKLPTTPLEALNGEPREAPWLNKIWAPSICGIVVFTSVVMTNWGTRRPLFAGIQNHILLTTGAAALGKFIEDYRLKYLAERDAVLRHYVELHPEDFPPFQSQKYADVLQPWVPIR